MASSKWTWCKNYNVWLYTFESCQKYYIKNTKEKILRFLGVKGHRLHTGGHVDPAFLGHKTCIFTLKKNYHSLKYSEWNIFKDFALL